MYDMFNGMEPGEIPIAGLSYLMFMGNGQPGYYMLYNDLTDPSFALSDMYERDNLLD